MSIVIHGMEMPKKGESGRIAILLGSDGIADVYNFCGTRLGKYICECSVIELPPHGDLIDRSKIVYTRDACEFRSMDFVHRAQLENVIPVILAEE